MIKAIKNENIYHSVLNYEDIIEDKNNFRCVDCDEEVIFVDSIAKQKHFRHKVERACSFEPETKDHI